MTIKKELIQFQHDDSVNDRSAGSKLNTSDEMTRKLWSAKFNVPFARPGSMFRGNPPNGKLLRLTSSLQRSLLAPKEMDVELDSVRLNVTPKARRNIANALSMMKPLKKEEGATKGEVMAGDGGGGDETTTDLAAAAAAASEQPELSLAVQLTSKGNKNMTLYNCDVVNPYGGSSTENDENAVNGSSDASNVVVIENPPTGLVHFQVRNAEMERRRRRKLFKEGFIFVQFLRDLLG